MDNSPVRVTNNHGTTKYSKLENELDSPQRQFLNDTLSQQQYLTRQQEEHLEAISDSLGSLKTVSRHIGIELDEQAGMLDEFGTELENTDSKLDSTMKKVAKVLRMSNGICICKMFSFCFILSIIFYRSSPMDSHYRFSYYSYCCDTFIFHTVIFFTHFDNIFS